MIKSHCHVLFEEALRRKLLIEGLQTVPLEALLALKYLSAVSPWRSRGKKYIDVGDFVITYNDNRERVDRDLLVDLASRAHEEGPQEFPVFLDAVENDRPVTI